MRVYAPLDDPAVNELDQVATKKGISRAQLIINAISSYLHQPEPSTEELDQMRIKLDQASSELDQLRITLDQKNSELDQLRITLDQKNSELDQLRIKLEQSNTEAANIKDELEQLKTKYNQAVTEDTKRWEELKGVKSDNTKLKKDLDAAQATTQRLQADLLAKQNQIDQVVGLKVDLAKANTEAEKLREAMKSRDADVDWLKSHVAQLTQQLALPPSEEEAKKKGRWQFWK